MRIKTYIATAMLAAMTAANATAKSEMVPKMYMFGFAASFNDSIVHFTDIIDVDSVWIDSKTKFLMGRAFYSNQLRDYLSSCLMDNRTCVVLFDKKRSKLEKRLLKMRKRYNSKKNNRGYDVRTIEAADFRFKSVFANYDNDMEGGFDDE